MVTTASAAASSHVKERGFIVGIEDFAGIIMQSHQITIISVTESIQFNISHSVSRLRPTRSLAANSASSQQLANTFFRHIRLSVGLEGVNAFLIFQSRAFRCELKSAG
jgi:hypothetical protein